MSYLAYIFPPAAVYFQIQAFRAIWWSPTPDRPLFVSHSLVSLSLWGFFMAFLSLSDSERMSPTEIDQTWRQRVLLRRVVWIMTFASIGTITLGLFLLLWAKDQLQGVAIICFGTGLLGMARLALDRLSHTLTIRAEPVDAPAATTLRDAACPTCDATAIGPAVGPAHEH